MPKVDEVIDDTPDTLKPYIFHGVDLEWERGGDEALGTCFSCGGSRFSVNIETGLWRCWSCNIGKKEHIDEGVAQGGAPYSFLHIFWEVCDKATRQYEHLATDRGLLHSDTLISWGIVKSTLNDKWMVPGYSMKGTVAQLYQYVDTGKRMVLFPTPGKFRGKKLGHMLHGYNLFDKTKEIIWLAEGPWDGMALWEILRKTKEVEGGFRQTGNESASLLAQGSVLAVPGCSTFKDAWIPLFAGKRVVMLYDNDHPKTNPRIGTTIPASGLAGMKRVCKLLTSSDKPPASVEYLCWGNLGYNTDLPDGYDVRDQLTKV